MKLNVFLTAASLLIVCACQRTDVPEAASHADAQTNVLGIDRGNGTDYISFEDLSAWFVGDGKVFTYCVVVDSDFGATQAIAEQSVARSLNLWKTYAADHAHQGPFGLTFDGTLQGDCSSADLRFYFGMRSKEVSQSIKQQGHRLGGAVRTAYDISKGWGSGFVWVASAGSITPDPERDSAPGEIFPDWRLPNALEAIVRHELGHVFGIQHVEGTIMDEYLANGIFSDGKLGLLPRGIDGTRQLLQAEHPYQGHLGVPSEEAANFQFLFGRAAVGTISAILDLENAREITITDSLGKFSLKFESFNSNSSEAISGMEYIFQSTVLKPDGKTFSNSATHVASINHLKVIASDGRNFNASSEQNVQSYIAYSDVDRTYTTATGFVLKIFDSSGPRLIFASSVTH